MDSDQLERAKLAMEEYKLHHAELLQRNTIFIQVTTTCIGGIVLLVGFMSSKQLPLPTGISLIALVLLLLVTVWKIIDNDAKNVSVRMIEIERYVNGCVGGDEKMPLSWERRFGLLKRGYLNRRKSVQEPDEPTS
jgi:hypothetical protein